MNESEVKRIAIEDFCERYLEEKQTYPTVREIQAGVEGVNSTSTCHKYFKAWREQREFKAVERVRMIPISDAVAQAIQENIDRIVSERVGIYESMSLEHSRHIDSLTADLIDAEDRAAALQKAVETTFEEKAELEIRLRLAMEKDDSKQVELKQQLLELNEKLSKERDEFYTLKINSAVTDVEMKNLREKQVEQKELIQLQKDEIEQLKAELGEYKNRAHK
ncbi:DNA-binding protein [Vibrio comitans]